MVSASAATRIRELEEEVESLNTKLSRAASRLAEMQATGKGGAEAKAHIAREHELERELDSAHDRIRKAGQENRSLEKTVTALRAQLSALEARKDWGGGALAGSAGDLSSLGQGVPVGGARRVQETTNLKDMYVKAKQEKDKAVRALIHVIGKDRVAAFLHKNAGSANILDLLLETFGGEKK